MKNSILNKFCKTNQCYSVITFIILFSISITPVIGAAITGTIYDLALQKESDVILEIDTVPKQLLVSKGGEYTFSVRPGNYTVYAHTSYSQALESIIVTEDGEYSLDIILEDIVIDTQLDGIDDDSNIPVSSDTFSSKTVVKYMNLLYLIIFVLISIMLFLVYMYIIHIKRNRSSSNVISHNTSTKHGLKSISESDSIKDGINTKDGSNTKQITHSKQEKVKDTNVVNIDEYELMIIRILKKEKRVTQKDLRKEIPLSEAKVSLIVNDLEDKGKIRKIKKGRGNVLIFVKD